jgi:phosphohistidine phosphatase SixA
MASPRIARHARLRDDGSDPPASKPDTAPKKHADNTTPLIRWSIQEVRRIAVRLARRRIQPAHIIARSTWRRAHQALAKHFHTNSKAQP